MIALLSHILPDGRTVLAELTEHSATPSMRMEAVGAPYAVKDDLRSRGYHWDPDSKVWWRDVPAPNFVDEETWLGRTVYGPQGGAKACGPRITEMSARDRYVSRKDSL